jgi:hypothetical protein
MYTMNDYSTARKAEDYVNAIAIWDALAPRIRENELRLAGDSYNPGLPAIFSSFMPKSGGTFLYNRMIQSVGYRHFHWGITKSNSLSEFYPTPASIVSYATGGFFSHTHALPSPYFKMVTKAQNVGPIWIHVRNPCEVSLAAFFHYRGAGQGTGKVGEARVAAIATEKQYLEAKHGYSFDDWNQFFGSNIVFSLGWLQQWVSYAEETPGAAFFTYFDELADVPKLFDRVFRQYGYGISFDKIDDILPDDRRRTDGQYDWREGLSPEMLEIADTVETVWKRALALRNPAGS